MNDTAATPAPAADPPPIDSRAAFVQALHWGFDAAIARQARQIVCIDRDFAHWPLDDSRLHAALVPWFRLPLRRLVLVAARFDEVPRRHPRFMGWRRDWAHAISPLSAPEELAASLPTLLLDDGPISVQLFDDQHWRGRAQRDARYAQALRLDADALMQRCSPDFAINVLGL